MFCLIMVNFVVNILMMTPLIYTGKHFPSKYKQNFEIDLEYPRFQHHSKT